MHSFDIVFAGANMLLARLANRAAKPNGQYYVPNEHIEEFMAKQKVQDLPGNF